MLLPLEIKPQENLLEHKYEQQHLDAKLIQSIKSAELKNWFRDTSVEFGEWVKRRNPKFPFMLKFHDSTVLQTLTGTYSEVLKESTWIVDDLVSLIRWILLARIWGLVIFFPLSNIK